MRQLRSRWVWVTFGGSGGLTIWTHATLPLVGFVRWRAWPRPLNRNGPVAGWRTEGLRLREHQMGLWNLVHDMSQEMPTERRCHWLAAAEKILNPDGTLYQ